MDTNIFWYAIYINDAFWIFFLVWEFIRLNFIWSTVCLILCVIGMTNTYAYFRCSRQQENIMLAIGKNIIAKQMK